MQVIIDPKSGFCFGVQKAIALAEENLTANGKLYCLGDIVHNAKEVERLEKLGLEVISLEQYYQLASCTVLLRAHGEPPEIYEHARKNQIELIDGTCKVVTKLQKRVKKSFESIESKGSLVIFGKTAHPEVNGLCGQVNYKAIVVEDEAGLDQVNLSEPIVLYAQTTMSREKYQHLKEALKQKMKNPELLEYHDTICGQVANRGPWLQEFSRSVETVVFVGGQKSSNSKVLFGHCLIANPNTFFVSASAELKGLPLKNSKTIGVCGATSTPYWLLEEVAGELKKLFP
ncbi:MAG: 4-hydroxy-3-methylbut-2-enyl diphosphate reductase [Bacteroidota bacterium]|nr:MAG: 4-hydroxy-3-methylbut-2-enyl diphosphate reductase [Bacteroidota bacterium]